ncbi:AAA family ATPase, partial [Pantanalinema rosaneae CENA516]|uniref:AAA family ATPase n=1 Tax=Pantanalinema rosaneae TaxID=1620701 RepID=UPI003D6E5E8C
MKLNIHNFRNFENQSLQFSRINILIGENSGGKSSLLKFLLSLKQTIDSPLESNLKLRGDYTDLGNYNEVVKDKVKTRKIQFSFSDDKEYPDYFLKFLKHFEKQDVKLENQIIADLLNQVEKTHATTCIKFTLSSSLNNHKSIGTTISNSALGKITIQSKKNEQYDTEKELSSSIFIQFNEYEEFELANCTTYKDCLLYTS